jgi:hypothetical protein
MPRAEGAKRRCHHGPGDSLRLNASRTRSPQGMATGFGLAEGVPGITPSTAGAPSMPTTPERPRAEDAEDATKDRRTAAPKFSGVKFTQMGLANERSLMEAPLVRHS